MSYLNLQKVILQSMLSNNFPSPTVLGSLPSQQFKQTAPKSYSWISKYLGRFKYSLRFALANLEPTTHNFKLGTQIQTAIGDFL